MSKSKPLVIRLGVQTGWNSAWWTNKSSFNFLVNKDLLIREYVYGCSSKMLSNKFLLDVVIKHTKEITFIHLFAVNLPYELTFLWYDRFLNTIRIGISRLLGLKKVNIKLLTHFLEGKNVQLSPKFLSKGLGLLLMRQRYKRKTGQRKKTFLHPPARYNWWEKTTKGWFFHIIRRALLKSDPFYDTNSANLCGIKLRWVGKMSRVGGKRSRFFALKKGFLPYQTIDYSVDYGTFTAVTRSGLVHFEVWAYVSKLKKS